MKERKIKLIIMLMGMAVIGLIAVQIFWIVHAVSIEKMRFDTNVNEALSRVVAKADKLETASVLVNKIVPGKKKVVLLETEIDSGDSNNFIWNVGGSEVHKLQQEQEIKIEFLDNTDSGKIHIVTENFTDSLSNIRQFEHEIQTVDSFVIKKSKLVQNVVDELIYRRRDVGKKAFFSESVIDSLLGSELKNKGITTNYYFNITTSKGNSYFTDKDSNLIKEEKETHKVQWNPDDVFHEASFLSVYFPDKNEFILKSIIWVLAISAVLIIVIIAVFYKTIRMLLRQKRLTEIKNDLINNITHEFKTPISTISLACEALNEPVLLESPNSVHRYSAMIREENKRLSTLVENLLNTAAIEKDEYKLEKEMLDMHEIIKGVVKNYRIKFDQKDADISFSLKAENPVISGDKFHLTNCISNLIDNAYKYTRSKPEIKIATHSSDNELVISISDNGMGIKKQDLSRIFDTFYRVPTGNIHDVKGNGIGLSYVKKMIEAHGGSVSVTSKPDKGSTFTVRMPNE